MLIRQAALLDGRIVDIRVGERILDVAPTLDPRGEAVILDGRGRTVIPGLHDHHVHLYSAAASLDSVSVGPAEVGDLEGLRRRLAGVSPGTDGWIRAVGYHESIAGQLDRHLLDEMRPDVPTRVQHRSGAIWGINSAGLAELGLAAHPDGILRSSDPAWSDAIDRRPVPLAELGHRLIRYGVTGVTDASPAGLSGQPGLSQFVSQLAPGKRILHDDELDLAELTAWITAVHGRGHRAAVHCVTASQLVVALAALRSAGVVDGDRIEHAAVVPADLVGELVDLGVVVVTQPGFVAERGDQYLLDVDAGDLPGLWRVGSLLRAGVRVALSTDMPFGGIDPWSAMRAAVNRTTGSGRMLNPRERVSPAQALTMFFGSARQPHVPRRIVAGERGDLCLLAGSPAEVLDRLDASMVVATVIGGTVCGQ